MNASEQAASIAIARQLASDHPGTLLPCPVCGVVVKAEKFQRHLEKVHPEHASARGPGPMGPLQVRGSDGKMKVPSAIVIGLWFAGAIGASFALQLKPPLEPLPLAIIGITGLLAFMPFIAAMAGKFPATLELDGDTVRVRWLLGLASKQASLPAKLETGSLTRQVGSAINEADQQTHAQQVGTYLRICGPRSLTIGTQNSAGLNKRWAEGGWSKGGEIGAADIEIDRESLIALEYRLAARGQLKPKSS